MEQQIKGSVPRKREIDGTSVEIWNTFSGEKSCLRTLLQQLDSFGQPGLKQNQRVPPYQDPHSFWSLLSLGYDHEHTIKLKDGAIWNAMVALIMLCVTCYILSELQCVMRTRTYTKWIFMFNFGRCRVYINLEPESTRTSKIRLYTWSNSTLLNLLSQICMGMFELKHCTWLTIL